MSKYQPQPREEIIKNLEMIAESKEIKLSDHVRASLWSAIEIIEHTKAMILEPLPWYSDEEFTAKHRD